MSKFASESQCWDQLLWPDFVGRHGPFWQSHNLVMPRGMDNDAGLWL